MKQYTYFNRFKVQFFITILAIVLLGANSSALADTVWSAGSTTVTDLLTDSTWSNGTPVTADNPGYINGDIITVNVADYRPGANGQSISWTLTGGARINLTGHFVPVGTFSSGNASFTLRLEDTASVTVANNNWVGNNTANSTLKPISGNDYVVSLYFTGSSKYTSFNEWWTAMSVKTLISIEDNAMVSGLGGNAGMGWCSNANDSLLNMSGGKLLVTADNFWIGDAENATRYGTATMNQSGGNAAIYKMLVGIEGSAYNLSDGEMNAGEMSIYALTNANLTGGKLTVGTLSNAGTITLNGATINLGSHGYINSTGTFDAKSGAINVNPVSDELHTYGAGDQILVGSFADVETANAVMALTSVPEGWTAGVVALNGQQAVIAQKGSAPTGVKVWTSDSTGNLSDGPWTGATSNSTGYVVGGTNTFNDFAGKVVVLGGTNKFTDDAVVHAGDLLVVNGGTNTYGTADIQMNGTTIVNGGSFASTNNKNFRVYGTAASPAYLEVNGGSFKAPRWLAIGNVDSTTETAKVVINNGIVQCGYNGAGGFLICDGKGVNAEVIMNGGKLQVNNSRPSNIAVNERDLGKFTMTNGYFTTGGEMNLGTGKNATGTFDMSGGIFVMSGALNVASGDKVTNGNGIINISEGIFKVSNTVSVATGSDSTGIINISGGEVQFKNLKLGRKGAGDSAQLNLSGGVLEITNGLYGSDSSPSGNVRITGTGQLLMNSSYSNANYAAIRELTVFEIEGVGNGSGALRFLQSSDCSVPITLTGNSTIGISTDAVFTQRAAINANSSDSVLTVKGGGTLVMTPSELGTLNKLKLDNSTMTLTGSDPINLHLSSVELDGGTLEFAEGTTYNPGTGDDEVPFTVSINDKGVVEFNGTLKLDAYQNSYMNGIDKFDFTNFEVDKSQVVFGDDFNIVVNLIDADNFTNQMVALAWAPGLPGDLINDADIAMSVLNTEGKILYWGFNADGSIFLGDANSVPEPSTWALMILGAAGLMYWRKRR